jgi:hypothetical protein
MIPDPGMAAFVHMTAFITAWLFALAALLPVAMVIRWLVF